MNAGRNYNGPMVDRCHSESIPVHGGRASRNVPGALKEKGCITKLGYMLETPSIRLYLRLLAG